MHKACADKLTLSSYKFRQCTSDISPIAIEMQLTNVACLYTLHGR